MTDELVKATLKYEGENFILEFVYKNTKYEFWISKEEGYESAKINLDDDDFDEDCYTLADVNLNLMSKFVNLAKAVKSVKG